MRQAREDAATLRGELADCSQRLRAAEVYKAPVIAAPVESPELQALKAEISAMAGEVKSIQERAREKEEGLQSLISFKQGELDTANRTVLELQSKVAELTAAAEAKPAPKRKR